jgi:hypothetical protein
VAHGAFEDLLNLRGAPREFGNLFAEVEPEHIKVEAGGGEELADLIVQHSCEAGALPL